MPESQRATLVDGRLVYDALPGPAHGVVQAGVAAEIRRAFHRAVGDAERPGGWWISQEVDMVLGGVGCRPDLLGWRRAEYAKMPQPDARGVVTETPAWICEVLSRTTAALDLGAKRRAYHRAGVEWYWIADPEHRTLTVLRRAEADYLFVRAGGVGDRLRAEPFEAVEMALDEVFDLGEAQAGEPGSG